MLPFYNRSEEEISSVLQEREQQWYSAMRAKTVASLRDTLQSSKYMGENVRRKLDALATAQEASYRTLMDKVLLFISHLLIFIHSYV